MLQQIPLSLYIHFPWCVRKCPYCDFNSHQGDFPETAYIQSLMLDLEQDLPLIWGRSVSTVFIGGGTPSLMSAAGLDTLLSGLRARLTLGANAEITLEANPGTVEQARFQDYRSAGVNRLSIGVQSFNDNSLAALGRIHDAKTAHQAVQAARTAGFDNINLDLMFALPGQSLDSAKADVEQALSHQPQHLSYYQLTLEPNTAFYAEPPELPDEDLAMEIQEAGITLIQAAGLRQYEISAYAQPGLESRHNSNYWRFADYLGIGAGAHAKITDFQQQKIVRYAKQRHPRQYMQAMDSAARYQSVRTLQADELPLEFMMNALRLNQGFVLQEFVDRTGLSAELLEKPLSQCIELGLLRFEHGERVCTTDLGRRYLNDVLQRFY